MGTGKLTSIDILQPTVIAGLFVGGMVPFLFASSALQAVGRAAFKVVNEVRRQFKELGLLKNDKNKPDYAGCVKISTNRALREMIVPSVLAVVSPIIIGFVLGPKGLITWVNRIRIFTCCFLSEQWWCLG